MIRFTYKLKLNELGQDKVQSPPPLQGAERRSATAHRFREADLGGLIASSMSALATFRTHFILNDLLRIAR